MRMFNRERGEAPMQSPTAVATLLEIANRRFRAVRSEDHGQDLLEYGLLAALIALVALGAVSVVGQTIYTVFWQTIAGTSL
jgi:Flp pilus assembly pilin Flp